MPIAVLTFFLLSILPAVGQSPLDQLAIPERHRQAILVTTDTWNDSVGRMELFYRAEGGWESAGDPREVTVGRNGLAWGRGLHVPGEPEKVEGDGRAPAGIFELAETFGYDSLPPEGTKLSYRQATSQDYWIDDVDASEYNQWIRLADTADSAPGQHWDSFERMRRDDHQYELGIIVRHNLDPVVTGKGSAIFMHVWREAGEPTAGCTAMPKEELLQVIGWLDPEKRPLLIQVPVNHLADLKFRKE